MAELNYIAQFIKEQRKAVGLSQEELAARAGVGLRFIRELEQGKGTLKMDKVNQVMELFGYHLIPGKELDPYQVRREYLNRPVRIYLKNKVLLMGNIIAEIKESNEIKAWQFIRNNDAIAYQETGDSNLVTRIAHKDIERIENI